MLGVKASAVCIALLAAPTTSMTTTNGVQFLFPTRDTTLHYNDYVQVQYTSSFSEPWLYTFCLSADGDVGQKQHQAVGGGNNTATVGLSWSGSDTPCWFDLKPSETAAVGTGANSDQWSFDVSQRAATTVGLEATSSSVTSTLSVATFTSTSASTNLASTTSASAVATATTGGAPSASSSATAISAPSNSSGLSTGAYAGIGAAAAIAGIAIGGGAVLLCLRRRRDKAALGIAATGEALPRYDLLSLQAAWEAKHGVQGPSLVELDSRGSAAHEMFAGYPTEVYEMPTRQGAL